MSNYQDIWVNDVVLAKGVRDCASRYEPVKAHCEKYDRPFTVLDIGANLGYYSFRLCSDFDCTAVMIEGVESNQRALLKLAKKQVSNKGLILLGKRVNIEELRKLSMCEHFDVVLALRVVHHFEEAYSEVIKVIESLGDYTFFELPTAAEERVRSRDRVVREMYDHTQLLSNYSYERVGKFEIHVGDSLSQMYLVKNSNKPIITRPFLGSPRHVEHVVKSTFDIKRMIKNDPQERGVQETEWIQGINLYTYNWLNGKYPRKRKVAKRIKNYPLPEGSPLTDIRPWNFIISGQQITLIDHTSKNNSLGIPFKDNNPNYSLTNTALQILGGRKILFGELYNRHPFRTKLRLLRSIISEIGLIGLRFARALLEGIQKLVDILTL